MSLDSGIRLWDLANARVLKTYTGHNATKHAGNAAFAFLPKDALPRTLIIGCSEDRMIYIWDLQTKEIVGKLHGHRDTISCVAVRISISHSGPSNTSFTRLRISRARSFHTTLGV